MAIIKELNPGDTLKVYEDGIAAEFVVAQHNYEKDLNGKGKTMLMQHHPAERRSTVGQQRERCFVEERADPAQLARKHLRSTVE